MSEPVRIVDSATGEAIEPCDEARARELTACITSALGQAWEAIIDAYREGAWAALGYASWDAYVAGEFGSHRVRLPREDRREIVGSMRDAGMSIRAIAAATGQGVASVHRALPPVPDGTPDEPEVRGRDGKNYPATRPEPAPELDEAVERHPASDPTGSRSNVVGLRDRRLTDDQQREVDRQGALRRRRDQLHQLVNGWLLLVTLPERDDRDEILAGLTDDDRHVVTEIEAIYLRGVEDGRAARAH